ncbi:lysozyme inhibitor LprI family protein [Pseudomonas violetae]|uniref:Lysozyme inhibitor LprI family protein n=1 Tax=Pseudomonas violetae TaxID=2915813 RepID=A0ABT0ESS0_9PSED|nr:lysozyme inhibitor LprI family protein [Pseudomonas violetae]MCK1788778.1 lysozyme inhibitor LprI family protein [Pseudomonas violetae]
MPRKKRGLGICILLLSFCSIGSQASSFDCAKAVSFAENTICADASLSSLDETLNSQYIRALDSARDKGKVRLEQREWLRLRDNCRTSKCLNTSLSGRLSVLAGAVTQTGGSSSDGVSKRAAQSPVPGPTVAETPSRLDPESKAPTPIRPPQDSHQAFLSLKIVSLVTGLLLLICVWLHHRGSMTIYHDYTDALFTSLTPILGIGVFWVGNSWLEIPKNYSFIGALLVIGIMSVQVLIQTYRSNGLSVFFLLSLFAKFALLTFYLLTMALLLLSGARNKREARRQRGLAVLATTTLVLLSGWMCRHRQFSSIDDYIAGRT